METTDQQVALIDWARDKLERLLDSDPVLDEVAWKATVKSVAMALTLHGEERNPRCPVEVLEVHERIDGVIGLCWRDQRGVMATRLQASLRPPGARAVVYREAERE